MADMTIEPRSSRATVVPSSGLLIIPYLHVCSACKTLTGVHSEA